MTVLDCLEVILFAWQDIWIQLLTNSMQQLLVYYPDIAGYIVVCRTDL